MKHKAGFVNIIGNPNVGKSTLMNVLIGEKLSIITNKAQTTRHRILGILNKDEYQIVFSDTPGIINPAYELQKSMMNFVESAFQDADILIYINGELLPRNEAKISVFDSAVQGGDAVWEGLRVYNGRIAALNDHLQRLQNSAKALMFKDVPSIEEVKDALFKTLEANGMWDQTHVRLTLTRGEKITSGMNPSLNQSGCTLIVLAEWKPPVYSNSGIKVITSSIRRNSPHFLDSKIHHNNLLNNILAIIEANVSGVDSAIMLDNNGFISETNDTNIFIVIKGRSGRA